MTSTNLLWPSQLSFEGGLSNVLLFNNIGFVGIKVSVFSFLLADRERSKLRPETMENVKHKEEYQNTVMNIDTDIKRSVSFCISCAG